MREILVTGGNGFLGSHIVLQLLQQGHAVRATVRSADKARALEASISGASSPETLRSLEVVTVDLMRDEGWPRACAGCDYVMHVASPMTAATTLEEVSRPAVEGSLRVLRAAREAGVRRVIVTSSCGAIYYGHPLRDEPFDESFHTDIHGGEMSLYVKSKALADQAVWEFADSERDGMEVTSIHPAGIFGPALGADYSSSLDLIRRLLVGMPGCPDLWFGIVDVRDCAALHLAAIDAPQAAGERFIATAGPAVSMLDVARVLRERLGERARRVPTRAVPNVVVRILALFNREMAALLPLLGSARHATSAKAHRLLGWTPRPWQDAVVATAESLIELGVVEG